MIVRVIIMSSTLMVKCDIHKQFIFFLYLQIKYFEPWQNFSFLFAGCLLLSLLLCLSTTLPRIPDYWVRHKLCTAKRALGCFASLAFPLPWNAVEMREEEKRENVDSGGVEFHCWVGWWNVWNFNACVSIHSQLLHRLHHVPRLLAGAGQRRQVGSSNVVPGAVQGSPQGTGHQWWL